MAVCQRVSLCPLVRISLSFLLCGYLNPGRFHLEMLNWLHLQRPHFQIRTRSGVLSRHEFWGILFNTKLSRWHSGKESACQCRRRGFNPWVGKIPWRRKWQPTAVFLPGESHGQRSLVGYSPWGCNELDPTVHAHTLFNTLQSDLILVLLLET